MVSRNQHEITNGRKLAEAMGLGPHAPAWMTRVPSNTSEIKQPPNAEEWNKLGGKFIVTVAGHPREADDSLSWGPRITEDGTGEDSTEDDGSSKSSKSSKSPKSPKSSKSSTINDKIGSLSSGVNGHLVVVEAVGPEGSRTVQLSIRGGQCLWRLRSDMTREYTVACGVKSILPPPTDEANSGEHDSEESWTSE